MYSLDLIRRTPGLLRNKQYSQCRYICSDVQSMLKRAYQMVPTTMDGLNHYQCATRVRFIYQRACSTGVPVRYYSGTSYNVSPVNCMREYIRDISSHARSISIDTYSDHFKK